MNAEYSPTRVTAQYLKGMPSSAFHALPAATAILPFIKPTDVGVEIGIFTGASSVLFLEHCAHMFLIDPCADYKENSDPGYYAVPESLLQKLAPFDSRYTLLRTFSAEAAPSVPEVDFVFIDGNHDYAFVKQDIELYWPKVRRGGFLSGHDYGGDHYDVTRAVHEFADQMKLPLEIHHQCWRIPHV